MYPVKGLFNLSEYNEGGRTTIANRINNHRIAIKQIQQHPKHTKHTKDSPLIFRRFKSKYDYSTLLYK